MSKDSNRSEQQLFTKCDIFPPPQRVQRPYKALRTRKHNANFVPLVAADQLAGKFHENRAAASSFIIQQKKEWGESPHLQRGLVGRIAPLAKGFSGANRDTGGFEPPAPQS